VALVCVGSARGAPGATTLALCLAASWPRPVVLMEADPAGGVLATRYRLGRTPGLADLAAAVPNRAPGTVIWNTAQALPGGLATVVAPESGEITSGILRDVARTLGEWCARLDEADVIADCGRVGSGSPALGLVSAADAVLVVCRPRADELYPAAHRLHHLAASDNGQPPRGWAGLVLVGRRPYEPDEITAQLGVPVVGVVEEDHRSATAIRDGGSARALRRSLLVRSVAGLVDELTARLGILPPSEPAPQEATLPAEPEASEHQRGHRGRGERPVEAQSAAGAGVSRWRPWSRGREEAE
jgi:MinD-like ATPase involved in chromosome partitioning or flagellar assembly